MEKNNTISLVRVISMFLIVLCHIIGYYKFIPGSGFLGQIFNVGVYTFFIISGYLYGNKIITNFKVWIKKRWCKIVIPVIIVTFIDILLLSIAKENISVMSFLYYFFNIQGLTFISENIFRNLNFKIVNLGHLWFTTIIMLCYCFVPLFQKVKKYLNKVGIKYEILMVSILFVLNFIITATFNVTFIYFIVFYFGYIMSSLELEKNNISNKKYVFFTFLMMIIQLIRLATKAHFDQTTFYIAIVGISHFILGLWIFITMFKLRDFSTQKVEYIANLKLVKWLDRNSYNIYLTHGMFCMGETLNVFCKFDNIFVSSLLFCILTIGMVYILAKFLNIIDKIFDCKKP